MFTKDGCSFCEKAKRLLIEHNLPQPFFVLINPNDENPKVREFRLMLCRNRTTVPQIFFGAYHIGGHDDLCDLFNLPNADEFIQQKLTEPCEIKSIPAELYLAAKAHPSAIVDSQINWDVVDLASRPETPPKGPKGRQNLLIGIEGSDCMGKTSLVQRLVQQNPAMFRSTTTRHTGTFAASALDAFFDGRTVVSEDLRIQENWLAHMFAAASSETRDALMNTLKAGHTVFADRDFVSKVVYHYAACAELNSAMEKLIETIVLYNRGIPKPDVVIWLRPDSINTAMFFIERAQKNSRYCTRQFQMKLLNAFDMFFGISATRLWLRHIIRIVVTRESTLDDIQKIAQQKIAQLNVTTPLDYF